MDVAVGGGRPPVPEQATGDVQALAVHDRVGGVRMSEIVKSRIRHDPGHVAGLDPEPVKRPLGQRSVSDPAWEHPIPGSPVGEAVEQRPRRLAEQNVPRSGLGVNQGEPVRPDLAPTRWDEIGELSEDGASARLQDSKTGPRTLWLGPQAVKVLTGLPRHERDVRVFP